METLQRTANRGSISTGYDIDNSVKLEDANNEWFYSASPTAGNRRTYTFSFWIKRTEIGAVNASGNAYVIGAGQHGRMFFGSDYFQFRFDDGHDCRNISVKFRDTSAWYHFVVAVDTNQLSSSNRVKLYVNGESLAVDDHDGGSFPDLADQGAFFSTNYITIGTAPFGGTYNAGDGDYDMSGYLSEFCAIDGQQLDPTSFGEYDEDSGIWKPIDVSGLDFGSQGYYLNFSDSANLGDDASGNSNDFAENNITAADQATDTPTNNFSNLEVGRNPAATFLTFNEGNTKLTYAGSTTAYDSDGSGISNFRVNTSGKWYMEFSFAGDGDRAVVGVVSDQGANHAADTDYTRYIMYRGNDGAVIYNTNGSDVTVSGAGPTYDSPDIIGIALDCDNERVSFSKNGSWIDGSGSGASNSSPTYYVDWTGHDFLTNSTGNGNCVFVCTNYVNNGTPVIESNFGGYTTNAISSGNSDANGYGNFEYAPPTGYYALCTKNLAEYG